jgi:hypothetical protein
MRSRCLNPSDQNFANYGGRGITVCERWRSFEAFLADMGERPPGHSVERKDNDGPYSPENCVWATRVEQANNSRRNLRVAFQGETLTATQWARRFGLRPQVVRWRLHRGWPIERALAEPSPRRAAWNPLGGRGAP